MAADFHRSGARTAPAAATAYTEIKDLEHEEFMRVISPWEREHLLLHV